MWGPRGWNLNTSKPPAAWVGEGREGWHSQGSLQEAHCKLRVCTWRGGGVQGQTGGRGGGQAVDPHPLQPGQSAIVLAWMEPSGFSTQWNSTVTRCPLNTRQADVRVQNKGISDLGCRAQSPGAARDWCRGRQPLPGGARGERPLASSSVTRASPFTVILGIRPSSGALGSCDAQTGSPGQPLPCSCE